jgi:hypothetical protein
MEGGFMVFSILDFRFPISGRRAETKIANRKSKMRSAVDDLGADAPVGEDLQEQAVRQTTVDEMDALDAFLKGADRALDLRSHALVHHAFSF